MAPSETPVLLPASTDLCLLMLQSPVTVCLQGPELLPDHQEAHRPVGDPQEAGQDQDAALLLCGAVHRRRPAHVQELRHL